MPSRAGGLGRREALSVAAATCAGALGAAAGALPGDDVSADELAAFLRTCDRNYSESERKLMNVGAEDMRHAMRRIRQTEIAQGAEPAIRFDPWVPCVPLPEPKGVFRPTKPDLPAWDGVPESLAYLPVTALSALLRARKVTSVDLTRMYLDRLRRFDPQLLCVVTLTEDLAMRQAERADREIAAGKWRGPLHGIPWGAKDLLFTKGIRTTFGARPYENQVVDVDATVVRRLDEAGAVLLAKLSLGELAMGDVWFKGMTRCPWDPKIGSSGSSAGPAAATAAGLVGFSIGSETLGSIVSPCVRNGTTGLRPTYGRVPRTGAMALSWTMDKLGVITRSVEDCALVLKAIAGPDGQDLTCRDIPVAWEPAKGLRGLRIGVDQRGFEGVKEGSVEKGIHESVLAVLTSAGAVLEPVDLPIIEGAFADLTNIIDVEGAASFARLIAAGKLSELVQQGPNNWPNIFRIGTTVQATDYLAMMQLRGVLQRRMAEAMREIDAFVGPPFSSLILTNLTGHPAVITRAGMNDGKPAMIQFTGQLYREDAALRAAWVFEQAAGVGAVWPKLPV